MDSINKGEIRFVYLKKALMEVAFKVGLEKSIVFVLVMEYFGQRGTTGAKS